MIDLKNLNIIVTGATGVIGSSILDKLVFFMIKNFIKKKLTLINIILTFY